MDIEFEKSSGSDFAELDVEDAEELHARAMDRLPCYTTLFKRCKLGSDGIFPAGIIQIGWKGVGSELVIIYEKR
jgi:hypothetical protein